MAAGNEGDGKGGNAQKRPFKSGGNRSGISDVIAKISPFVDSRNDQPRMLRKNRIYREMDAIRRSPIHCKEISFYSFNPEGTVQREGMGDGTLFPIRSYDENLSYLGESSCQKDNSLGIDSIIIGNQNLGTFTHYPRITKIKGGRLKAKPFSPVPLASSLKKMVGARGFEPPTPGTPCQCATRLRYAPNLE